ncbi:MAG: hypothetical protein ABJA64_01695 [Candidatus Saccharibacteria bacterium]
MSRLSKKQTPARRRSESSDSRPTSSELSDRYAFKRNRTLTGSSSSHIVSTAEGTGQLKSPRVHAHHLADQRRRLGGSMAIVLLAALILFGLISQFTADAVIKIKDMPTATTDQSYAKIIDDYFGQRPIERFRFLLNEHTLTQFIQSKAPEISSASTDGSAGFGKSTMVLVARKPVAGWNMAGIQEYVDGSGTTFTKNYYPSPSVQIVDNSGVPAEAGKAVASNRFLSFIGRLVGLAGAKGYSVEQVIIPPDTTRQVALKIKDIPYQVKCSIDRPAGEQVEDLNTSIVYLKSHGLTPSYLDVRVSGKAFYR